jgi:branched-chain amino acid transport system permease protein
MSIVLDIIVMGLITGSIYALLAVSFSLIFGVARIVNIAHTAFYMVAAYCIYTVTHYLGWHPVPAMLIAVVISILLGMIVYKLFLNPIREHEGAVLIATMAIAMIFQEVMILAFSGTYLSVPNLIDGFVEILGVKVFNQQLLTLAAAVIVMVLLVLFLFKTNLGLALRSTAQDREVANLMGINESKVAMITMGIAIGLAGFAGAIVVPLVVLEPHMWMTPLVMMMAVVVLGGLGSLKGSFVGAYIMGFTEAIVVFLTPQGAYLKISVALLIMVIVLLIRPEGLFGVYFEEER